MKRAVLINLAPPVAEGRVMPGDIGFLNDTADFVQISGRWWGLDKHWDYSILPGGFSIEGQELTGDDIGRRVLYIPGHAYGDRQHHDCERGTLMHWNASGAMVDYGRHLFCRTDFSDLRWL